ncbi:unnamed protein product [Owenia fusiformis]|uniref:Uncharacterized protein n=1 Tax=Owenia fusiformis TaxID=6347 RepID=A0A8J1XX25_OWEFU|nr:unnamed protein product [Owenia fusiformis]
MVDRLVNSEANARRINLVEQAFGTSGQSLVQTGRVLVGEGVLTKMCRKGTKPRQFFLFNDVLVYGNIVIAKKKYNKQHIIPLEDVTLTPVDDEGNLRNGWQIKSPFKSFTVYAATATEKTEWMAHINKCVQDLLTKRGKAKSDMEDSPVWVPDKQATHCMHCKKSEFTVLNRRHHCRKCGMVACSNCTSKKWLFPQQSSKPLRICLTCYDQLANAPNAEQEKAAQAPAGQNYDSDSSDDEDDDVPNDAENSDQPTFYENKNHGATKT